MQGIVHDPQRQFLDHGTESDQGGLGARREQLLVDHARYGVPKAEVVLAGEGIDLLDGGAADAAGGGVDDPQQADRIVIGGRQLQVGDGILDLSSLIKTESADDQIFAAVTAEGFFNLARLGVGAVEDGNAIIGVFGQKAFDGLGDEHALVFGIPSAEEADQLAATGVSPKGFAFARLVIGYHGAGGGEDILGGTIVLLEADGLSLGEVVLEIEDVLDIGAAPAIDGLIFVAHNTNVVVRFGEQAHELVLAAIGVLILVDHDVAEAAIVERTGRFIVEEEADGFEQEVVEIEGIGGAEGLLVFVPNDGELSGGRIDGIAVEILGGLLQVLGVADPRKSGAILHELLIEAQVTETGLDERELIIIVIDAEMTVESGTNLSEGLAIAAQKAHAEGVEGGQVRRGGQIEAFEQGCHARAHLGGRLIGEGDRQNGGRGHMLRRDYVGDAMSNYACFTATGACQNQ